MDKPRPASNTPMNYAAINAKLKAMSARLLKPQDYEAISQMDTAEDVIAWLGAPPEHKHINDAATRICRYIPDKTQKDYVRAMAAPSGEGSFQYYIAQWKRLGHLDKSNRIALRDALGAEIDLNNILWMYRLKRYHRIKGNETYGYLVPIRYRLSHEATQRMADCPTPKALLDEVAYGPYKTDIVISQAQAFNNGPYTGQSTPEQALAKAIQKRYETAARRYPNTLATALAYLYKKKLEMQWLLGAIQGR